MVCDRCKATVERALSKSKILFEQINLGEIKLKKDPTSEQLARFKVEISNQGFEMIESRTSRTISQIKSAVIEFVRDSSEHKPNFSDYIIERLHKDYSGLSNLFSSVEGQTIERYLILHKIERAKELIVYDELSMQQIADALDYSSVPHFSNQFKKITGLSPSHFKKVGIQKRKPLDGV